jgi:hypothetical protein
MKAAGILCVFLFLSSQIYAQDSGIKVITSARPIYPPTAKAVGATGEVDVMAALDDNGDVISAEVFTGHPLFRTVSKDAALKWKFGKNPVPDAPRSVVIAFYFGVDGQIKVIEKSEKQSEEVSEVMSPSFSRIEMRFNTLVPKLLLLPREKGEIKAEKCNLHDEWMGVEILPVSRNEETYVATFGNKNSGEGDEDEEETYYQASEKYFPNAWPAYYGSGLFEATEKAEVHYCKSCRAKREEWLKRLQDQ